MSRRRVVPVVIVLGLLASWVVALWLNGWRIKPDVGGPEAARPTGLESVAAWDYAAFRAWLAGKGTPESEADRARITEAEAAWADRTVTAVLARADDLRPFMPADAREVLFTAANELRSLAGELKPDGSPFTAARRRLFAAALAEAQAESHRLLAAGDGERAFGVARAHAVNWWPEARALGDEAAGKLTRFRDGHEFLAGWAGTPAEGPGVAPTPRVREVAPPPRTVP